MSKYVDLTCHIYNDRIGACEDEIEAVLEWLDRNCDQVPGRTVNQSRIDKMAADTSERYMRGVKAGLILAGGEIVPDPEPTSAEKLADDIRQLDFEGTLGSDLLARELTKRGWTKAPEADDE